MTEIAKIVETTETDKAFLSELNANTVPAQLLKTELTQTQSCDFTTVPNILQEPSMKAAFSHLKEFGTASAYANRFWQNFWVNNDAVSLGRTLQTLGAANQNKSIHLSSSRFVTFSDVVDRGEVIDGASIDPDNTNITINQTGIWMVSWNAAFSFFPEGYGNQAFGGFTTNPVLTDEVRVGCGLVITDEGATRYAAFKDTKLVGKHLKDGTPKLCGASQIIKLSAGNKVRLHWARSGSIGEFMNGTTAIKERLGLRKMQNVMTGGIPTRDAANVLTLVRLS